MKATHFSYYLSLKQIDVPTEWKRAIRVRMKLENIYEYERRIHFIPFWLQQFKVSLNLQIDVLIAADNCEQADDAVVFY